MMELKVTSFELLDVSINPHSINLIISHRVDEGQSNQLQNDKLGG